MGAPTGHPRWGGRQKGTPNKRTQDVIGLLEALGCDPIEGMARIAMDENNAPELRGRMYAELSTILLQVTGWLAAAATSAGPDHAGERRLFPRPAIPGCENGHAPIDDRLSLQSGRDCRGVGTAISRQ